MTILGLKLSWYEACPRQKENHAAKAEVEAFPTQGRLKKPAGIGLKGSSPGLHPILLGVPEVVRDSLGRAA